MSGRVSWFARPSRFGIADHTSNHHQVQVADDLVVGGRQPVRQDRALAVAARRCNQARLDWLCRPVRGGHRAPPRCILSPAFCGRHTRCLSLMAGSPLAPSPVGCRNRVAHSRQRVERAAGDKPHTAPFGRPPDRQHLSTVVLGTQAPGGPGERARPAEWRQRNPQRAPGVAHPDLQPWR